MSQIDLFTERFRDPALCRGLLAKLGRRLEGVERLRFMEVCGTHTVAIFQSGLHSVLPARVEHVSGPGCPVCVTHESEVAVFCELAGRENVIVATFGDLMRVPGPGGASLKSSQAEGARVEVVYSPLDALRLAANNPGDKVVFLGVGFETTAPTVAAAVKAARARGLDNFMALSFHKLVPPALEALLADPEASIDGFILPGHVSTIIGAAAYRFLPERHNAPCVVAGFEPADILESLILLADQVASGASRVENAYRRAVAEDGNPAALAVMYEVFEPRDALWRGIGAIPGSGLGFRADYAAFDAFERLGLSLPDARPLPGCRCGDVLKGKLKPNQCPLFKKVCAPNTPVGPCMVSTEGSCAAYHKYHLDD